MRHGYYALSYVGSPLDTRHTRMCAVQPNLSPANVAAARFSAQLEEAKRLRDALPEGAPDVLDSFAAHGLSCECDLPESCAHGTRQLRELLTRVLGLQVPLERLHEAIEDFSPSLDAHARVMDAKKVLLAPLADERRAALLLEAYDSFVLECIAPHIADAMGGGCDAVYYAHFPTVRVQVPSEGVATIRPHCDGIYGLQAGSVNFWVPLTEVHATSALWAESAPGRNDFAPLTRPTRFDGRRCVHFSVPNRSGRTRVSLDFRAIPAPFFDPHTRLSRLGYFSTAARTPGGSFSKVSSGRLSELHGLPHTARPQLL